MDATAFWRRLEDAVFGRCGAPPEFKESQVSALDMLLEDDADDQGYLPVEPDVIDIVLPQPTAPHSRDAKALRRATTANRLLEASRQRSTWPRVPSCLRRSSVAEPAAKGGTASNRPRSRSPSTRRRLWPRRPLFACRRASSRDTAPPVQPVTAPERVIVAGPSGPSGALTAVPVMAAQDAVPTAPSPVPSAVKRSKPTSALKGSRRVRKAHSLPPRLRAITPWTGVTPRRRRHVRRSRSVTFGLVEEYEISGRDVDHWEWQCRHPSDVYTA